MSRLHSLRQKIAFLFFVITAAAFSAIWFVVVPQLETNLKERRLTNLIEEAKAAKPALEARFGGREPSRKDYAVRIRAAEGATDAQVTVRDWQRDWSPSRDFGFYPVDDSRTAVAVPFNAQLAEKALTQHRTLTAYDTFHDGQVGMVVQPLRSAGN
ncbi:MAG TPA: hypothetical protein VK486_05800, partial [Thermoleophilaceae bacterium]|nr:hypothetical protein [Thermoleophilaceae bacterium]